jgi:hypothetical protein
MFSGLLLLTILLSSADATVRLAFLADLQGEVLLRLLGEVASGKQQTDSAGHTEDGLDDASGSFVQWQAAAGASGLAYQMAGSRRKEGLVPRQQAVLQVLLWCFFEVAPPQQQQQQQQVAEEEEVASSSSSSASSCSKSDYLSAEHMQVLQQAAERGVLWSSTRGEHWPCSLTHTLPATCLQPGGQPTPEHNPTHLVPATLHTRDVHEHYAHHAAPN